MRNRFNIFIVAIVLISISVSCNHDMLELKPQNAYSEIDVFNDAGLLNNYVNGVYLGIHQSFDDENSLLDGFTDNAFNRQGGFSARQYTWFHHGINLADGENMTRGSWANDFTYIRNINLFLEKTTTSKVDATTLAAYTGEMHFLRAFYYFDLLKWYGGVPIITKAYGITDSNYDLARNSIDEVVKFISDESDLAIASLPSITNTKQKKGRASKEAAMALKARALLYAASPLFGTESSAKWTAASDANKAVMDLATVGLAASPADYGKLFHGTRDTEIIFARYFSQINQQNGWGGWGINLWLYSGGNGGWSDTTPTQDLVDSYELTNGKLPSDGTSGYDPQNPYVNRDPRFYETILFQGTLFFDPSAKVMRPMDFSYNGSNIDDKPTSGNDSPISTYVGTGGNNSLTGYNFRKYTDEGKAAGVGGADVNTNPYIFFRKSEFYLNYAECQIALNNETEAKNALNQIRANRGMPDITETGQPLVDRYRNERRVELVLEDHHLFDIRRWMTADVSNNKPAKGVIVINTDLSDDTKTTVDYHYTDFGGKFVSPDPTRSWDDRYYWMPIPPTEITLSNGKLVQNDAWK